MPHLRSCLAALLALFLSPALFAAPLPVKVSQFDGEVVQVLGTAHSGIVADKAIEQGSEIRTGKDGRAELSLHGDPTLAVGNGAQLLLHSMDQRVLRLRLASGALRIDTRAPKGGKSRDVRLNVGDLRVRVANADAWTELGERGGQLCLISGTVEAQQPNGVARLDTPGQCLRQSGLTSQWSMVPMSVLQERVALLDIPDADETVVLAAPATVPKPESIPVPNAEPPAAPKPPALELAPAATASASVSVPAAAEVLEVPPEPKLPTAPPAAATSTVKLPAAVNVPEVPPAPPPQPTLVAAPAAAATVAVAAPTVVEVLEVPPVPKANPPAAVESPAADVATTTAQKPVAETMPKAEAAKIDAAATISETGAKPAAAKPIDKPAPVAAASSAQSELPFAAATSTLPGLEAKPEPAKIEAAAAKPLSPAVAAALSDAGASMPAAAADMIDTIPETTPLALKAQVAELLPVAETAPSTPPAAAAATPTPAVAVASEANKLEGAESTARLASAESTAPAQSPAAATTARDEPVAAASAAVAATPTPAVVAASEVSKLEESESTASPTRMESPAPAPAAKNESVIVAAASTAPAEKLSSTELEWRRELVGALSKKDAMGDAGADAIVPSEPLSPASPSQAPVAASAAAALLGAGPAAAAPASSNSAEPAKNEEQVVATLAEPARVEAPKDEAVATGDAPDLRRWRVVLGSMSEREAAEREAERLNARGWSVEPREYHIGDRHGFRIGFGEFESREQAQVALDEFLARFPDAAAWLAKY